MLFFEFILYLIITFLLLGLRFGFALIVIVLSVNIFLAIFAKTLSPDEGRVLTEHALKYLEFYVYGMWVIGAIWRLLTFKRNWIDFKARWLERKKTNNIISKYQSSKKS